MSSENDLVLGRDYPLFASLCLSVSVVRRAVSREQKLDYQRIRLLEHQIRRQMTKVRRGTRDEGREMKGEKDKGKG